MGPRVSHIKYCNLYGSDRQTQRYIYILYKNRASCTTRLASGNYLFVIVETVYDWSLSGWQLRQNIQQLEHHILMVVNDGQVERSVEREREGERGTGR